MNVGKWPFFNNWLVIFFDKYYRPPEVESRGEEEPAKTSKFDSE